jgi:hypothetical protein
MVCVTVNPGAYDPAAFAMTGFETSPEEAETKAPETPVAVLSVPGLPPLSRLLPPLNWLTASVEVPEAESVPGLKVVMFVAALSLTSGHTSVALLIDVVVDCVAEAPAEEAELAAGLAKP